MDIQIFLHGVCLNHDGEILKIMALDNREEADNLFSKIVKEVDEANERYDKGESGEESGLDKEILSIPERVEYVYVTVANVLDRKGAGCYIHGCALSKEEALADYNGMVKYNNDYYEFNLSDVNTESISDEEGVLIQDEGSSDYGSMEFACVKVRVNGEPVIVDIG
ncbi:MAG: hypothetical protein PUF37_01050 [Prevotellaceae bacterium]|nr:hypothetical protein [Prevotellaceae bacterium]